MLKRDFESIRLKIDIVEYVEKHFDVLHDGPRLKIICPFHGDINASLVVYPTTQSFHCYGCGATGDVFDIMKKVTGRNLEEVLGDLSDGRVDYAYWRRLLRERKPIADRGEWFLVGTIALRDLPLPDADSKLTRLIEAYETEDDHHLPLVVSRILEEIAQGKDNVG